MMSTLTVYIKPSYWLVELHYQLSYVLNFVYEPYFSYNFLGSHTEPSLYTLQLLTAIWQSVATPTFMEIGISFPELSN